MESPPSLLYCGVCSDTADAVHFGGLSCRACAAFFRRKVAGGKMSIGRRCNGNCKLDTVVSRRLCPFCRYDKCLRIGMKTTAVLSRLATVKTEPGEGTSSGSGWAMGNLLEQMKEAHRNLENARRGEFMNEDRKPNATNYKVLNEICSKDIDLVYQHISQFFQSITPVNDEQRKYLGHQFIAPYLLLDGAWRSRGTELFVMPNGDYVDLHSLESFYQNPDEKDDSIAENVTTLMKPYWHLNNQVLRKNLVEVNLDLSEFLFVSALIFWDFGVPEQSDECIKVCKQMRSRIFEELTTYEKSKIMTEDHSLRVGEIVIVLQAVQKALGIMHECRDISIVYNLHGRECPLFKTPEFS
ncbi:unnamed protein product [Caenorhabditis nigoni]